MIKNLIFDVYGTLVTSGNGSVLATEKIFREFGYTEGFDKIYRRWKELHRLHYIRPEFKSEHDIYIEDLECLFNEMGIVADASIKIKPMIDSLYGRVLFPDVEKAMGEILDRYNVAIGSITDDLPLFDSMKDTVLDRIKLIYTSENLKVYKPNINFYKAILDNTGWNKDETVFIGDSIENDIIGPKSVGLRAILIDRKGKTSKEDLAEANFIISSMEELIDVLKNMD